MGRDWYKEKKKVGSDSVAHEKKKKIEECGCSRVSHLIII
jgi:hypothetical protein